MGRKSTIDRLSDAARAHIERRLAENRLTLDELIAELRAAYPEEAEELPSRSAVHRYGQKLDRRLSAIRASTEAAKLIQRQAGDEMDARSEALTALVQSELFETILLIQEADDPEADQGERLAMLSNAAKNIATLTRSSVNIKRFQAEAEERARKKLLEEQRAKLEAMPNKGGVTADTKAAIREALGII